MSRDNMDNSKLQTLRQFVTLAREYTAFRHEDTLNSLSKLLGTITTYDAGLFSPGKLQVSAFFTSLWEVMSISPVPLWIGVSVLSKAVLDPSTRNSLLHTYRFLPVLAKFLTENLSYDKKINILKLMEILSYGIKINWEESYLTSLMKLLCDWIINLCGSDVQAKAVSHLALAVLVNLCYGNVQVVAALMRTVDVRELIKRLVSLKEGDTAGVQVCRLLVALQETRGAPTANDVRNFLAVALQAFVQGIKLVTFSSKL